MVFLTPWQVFGEDLVILYRMDQLTVSTYEKYSAFHLRKKHKRKEGKRLLSVLRLNTRDLLPGFPELSSGMIKHQLRCDNLA